jgi:hypothetical protein
MVIATWILSGLLALAFLAAGSMKALTPRRKLAERMKWTESFTDAQVKLIGIAEVAGALGVILPAATGVLPVLSPIAALCLAVLMGGAVRTHLRLNEAIAPPAVLGALALLVAAARIWPMATGRG